MDKALAVRRRNLILILLLLISLCLHLVLFYEFIRKAFPLRVPSTHVTTKKDTPPSIMLDLQDDIPAQLTSGPSNFGKAEATEELTEGQEDSDKVEQPPPDIPVTPPEPTKKDSPPAPQEIQDNLAQEQDTKHPDPPTEQLEEKKSPAVDLKQLALSMLMKKKSDSSPPNSPSPSSKKTPPATPNNIMAQTRGFIQTLNNHGKDFLDRDGDPNKRPSFEEERYLSYIQKIVYNMQSASRIYFNNFQSTPAGKLDALIIIDRSGRLAKLDITEQSKSTSFNHAIYKLIKHAAPFPPLPKHFNRNALSVLLTFEMKMTSLSIQLIGGIKILHDPTSDNSMP